MKYAFLHIEKTGGSAIRSYLGDKIVEVPKQHKHAGWDYLTQFTDAPIITILRNPVDRAISHFHFGLQNWESLAEWAATYDGKPTIFDFYRDAPNHSCQWNRQMRLLSSPEQGVDIAIANLRKCAWVGVTETLDLPRENEGDYPAYSAGDREEIASYCGDDFEVWREAKKINATQADVLGFASTMVQSGQHS